jgi:hypothetical protein
MKSDGKIEFLIPVKDPGPSLTDLVHVQPLSGPVGELTYVEERMPDLDPADNICITFGNE